MGEQNVVSITFKNQYRKDGVGLHSFVDPKDGKQYLYTQFEADYCRFAFPVFDQPDLKAVWTFENVVEEDWNVVSNEYEGEDADKSNLVADLTAVAALFKSEEEKLEIEKPKTFSFRESAKISPYLFAIVAGPYEFVESPGSNPPMRLYARDSMMEWLRKRSDEVFKIT